MRSEFSANIALATAPRVALARKPAPARKASRQGVDFVSMLAVIVSGAVVPAFMFFVTVKGF